MFSVEVRPRQNVPIPRYQLTSLSSKLVIKVSPKSDSRNPVSTPSKFSPSYLVLEWSRFGFQGYRLPAVAPPRERCGSFFTLGCLNSSHPNHRGKYYLSHRMNLCKRGICSHLPCMRKWRDREAERIKDRLFRYIKKNNKKAKVIHVTVSPPNWDYSKPVKELKKVCYKLLQDVGLKGGSLVFHPARFSQDGTPKVSPHFHVLGVGWIIYNKTEYHKMKWVVRNLGVREDEGEVFATAQYELGHCGLKEKTTAVNWFGKLSYNQDLGQSTSTKKESCPYCGAVLCNVVIKSCTLVELDRPPPGEEWSGLFNVDVFALEVLRKRSAGRNPRKYNKKDGREGIGSFEKIKKQKKVVRSEDILVC